MNRQQFCKLATAAAINNAVARTEKRAFNVDPMVEAFGGTSTREEAGRNAAIAAGLTPFMPGIGGAAAGGLTAGREAALGGGLGQLAGMGAGALGLGLLGRYGGRALGGRLMPEGAQASGRSLRDLLEMAAADGVPLSEAGGALRQWGRENAADAGANLGMLGGGALGATLGGAGGAGLGAYYGAGER